MSATFFIQRLQTFFLFSPRFFTFFNVFLNFHLNVYYIYAEFNPSALPNTYTHVFIDLAVKLAGLYCTIIYTQNIANIKQSNVPYMNDTSKGKIKYE